jgi:creatinine amidohydrolase
MAMDDAKQLFAGNLSWNEVRDRLAAGAPAILPIGAGSKQHGLHLPLNTDAIQAEAFAQTAARHCHGLIWPTLSYGFFPAFTGYAGSVSIEAATFQRLVTEVVDSLLSQTRSFVLVIDTGISTIPCVARAAAASAAPERTRHWTVYHGAGYLAAKSRLETQAYGSHADEMETSLMLALAPELVDMARAQGSPPGSGAGASGRLDPLDASSPLYAPSGSWGDPARASREKGEALLAAIHRDLAAICDGWADAG